MSGSFKDKHIRFVLFFFFGILRLTAEVCIFIFILIVKNDFPKRITG